MRTQMTKSAILQSNTNSDKGKARGFSVAFQGEIGAYSQSAVYSFFGKENVREVMPLPTFRQVFSILFKPESDNEEKVQHERQTLADCAVLPIENSLAGSVGETLDLLNSNEVRIVGEVSIPISHALLVLRDSSMRDIRKVISHPQAIAQCKEYLDSKGWQQVSVYDTAGAAKMVRDEKLKDTAAIASELAAEIYGLKILERGIEDDHSNQTRFIVIIPRQKWKSDLEHKNLETTAENQRFKTSVLFSAKHVPGSLVEALSTLSSRGINLTKIESRPMKSRPWEYYFFVDFDGSEENETCREALADLRSKTIELKVLGSYEKGM
jgi:prephenate dehydratase